MSIRDWSDDLISGFPVIDSQHKNLFQMVNDFASKGDKNPSVHTLVTFLENLENYCETHFKFEEEVMQKYAYPLLNYHADLHRDLKRALKKIKSQVEQHTLDNPYQSIVNICTEWLHNHVSWEDLAFVNFYKNRNYSLGEHFVGRKCELMTVDNKPMGTGNIQSVQNNQVVVENTTGTAIPLALNEMIKVSSLSDKNENQTFIARVFYSTPEIIKLFNSTLIQTVNNRESFRVPTKLDATMLTEVTDEVKTLPVTILDVSISGLMIKSEQKMEIGDIVNVSFEAQNTKFYEPCEVVRALKTGDSSNTYGIKFISLDTSTADKIGSFVFNSQAKTRQMYRKS